MPASVSYIAEEKRLDLSFDGNLDVSVSQVICDICRQVPCGLRYCIVDLSGVRRLFDSGMALLQMLHRRLTQVGTTVVILSDSPEIRERIPIIAQTFPPGAGTGSAVHDRSARTIKSGSGRLPEK